MCSISNQEDLQRRAIFFPSLTNTRCSISLCALSDLGCRLKTKEPPNQRQALLPMNIQEPDLLSSKKQPAAHSLHQDDADEEDESVKQLGDCSAIYLTLQECLVNSNRNWKSCQPDVLALKACNERRMKSKTSD